MIRTLCKRGILGALLATSALASPALAQSAPAPRFVSVDTNGVDLTSALVSFAFEEGGIGSGPGRVAMERIWAEGAGWVDNWTGGMFTVTSGSVTKTYVQIAGVNDVFTKSGTTYTAEKANGATLVIQADGKPLYTAPDGTKIQFSSASFNLQKIACAGSDTNTCKVPEVITRPDGTKLTYTWGTALVCVVPGSPFCQQYVVYKRLSSVASSAGYSFGVLYATNSPGFGTEPLDDWYKRTSVTFNNSANSPSPQPSIGYAYPDANTVDVTDPGGRTWRFTTDTSGRLTGVRRPGSTSNNISYTYTSGLVTSATKDGVANSYGRSVSGSTGTMTVTNPLSQTDVIVSDLTKERPTSFQDGLGRTTSYQYDSNARLTQITQPEGDYTQLTYDGRGNVTTTTKVAKSGSGLSNIVTSASFDSTCTSPVKCNKPNTTTDAKGNVTDYTYDSTHGGVTSIKLAAPSTGVDRPETRFSYTQVTSASSDLVYMLTGTSACASGTAPSCVGTANETKGSASYNSNLLSTSVSKGNGTGTLTASSTMTYDARGRLDTVDGPLSGTADTIKYRYDSADQLIGETSPDPDGAGALKNRAIKLTYRSDGQVSKQERGTVNSQSDTDWAAMSVSETVDITYDSNDRVSTRKLSSGGTSYALTQYSYDSLGRVDCAAQRMNTAIYASLPSSACTLGTSGSFGSDQIGQTVYDAAGQVTQLKVAVGTTDAATERTMTYSNNGKLGTLKDAENNLTTYEYDGFDRLSKTRFPSTTKGAGTSSTTDYEQLTYDSNSNVTSRRLRDGNSIAYTFDNLDRPTLKNLPGTEPDVSYAYDNLNRLTSASQTGNALSFTYDTLSRNLTQVGPQGTVTSAWDLAGRRTQLTYPGSGLALDYDYLVTGEVQKIRENGATSGVGVLATYAYDDLGRRTSLTFGNGAVQNYTYDAVSRLASLGNNLSGTTNDLSATFSYSPASQISSTVRTGDAYAFGAHYNVNRNYTANGLNQYTSAGPASFTYDSKGNLTSDGTSSFTYSSENLLLTGPSSTTLAYDPGMRLQQIVSGGVTTKLAYDGIDRIAEYDGSSNLLRRYVHGPGVDDPIVWYEGSGTTDRRFLGSDERGSIISLTDSSGTLLGINRYDEYGIPQSTNLGVWGYTGQAWIPSIGLQYSKARMYSPPAGRFMQTDPIDVEGGINLYAYVGNDPINLIDPLGLKGDPPTSDTILVTGHRLTQTWLDFGSLGTLRIYDYFKNVQLFKQTKKRKNGDLHFRIQDFALCSADALFAEFSKAGNSAPGAPAAQPGTTFDIPLAGGNPITQIVNVSARTITNVTQIGHRYHSGTVAIRIAPTRYGSAVTIEGRGTGPHYLENRIGGKLIFTALAARATVSCSVGGK